MNKMLELMEEHFNEGDYVKGCKMIKKVYESDPDPTITELRHRIWEYEQMSSSDREYEEEINELEEKLSSCKEWNKKIQEDYIKTQEDYIIALEEKGDLLEIITLLRVQNKLLRENNLLKEIRKC